MTSSTTDVLVANNQPSTRTPSRRKRHKHPRYEDFVKAYRTKRDNERIRAELENPGLTPDERAVLQAKRFRNLLVLKAIERPSRADNRRVKALRKRLATRRPGWISPTQPKARTRQPKPAPIRAKGSRRPSSTRTTGCSATKGQDPPGGESDGDDPEPERVGAQQQLQLSPAEPGLKLYRRDEIAAYIERKSAALAGERS